MFGWATTLVAPAILRTRRTDPWCSGPTCQPVTLEIAGSNPVGSASSNLPTPRPPARTGRSFLPRPSSSVVRTVRSWRSSGAADPGGTIAPVKRVAVAVAAVIAVALAAQLGTALVGGPTGSGTLVRA